MAIPVVMIGSLSRALGLPLLQRFGRGRSNPDRGGRALPPATEARSEPIPSFGAEDVIH